MNEFVKDLNDALRNVSENYIRYRNIENFQEDEIQEKSLEAVFCAELYHCWRLIQSQKDQYQGLILDNNIGKKNFLREYLSVEFQESALYREVQHSPLIKRMHLYPDFTLHGGNDNINNQKLIVEVKTNENISNENFKIDFYRLLIFKGLYGFENVVFLIINIEREKLEDLLRNVNIDLVDKEHFYFILKTTSEQHCFRFGTNKELIDLN